MLTAFSFNFAHIMVMENRPLRQGLLAHFLRSRMARILSPTTTRCLFVAATGHKPNQPEQNTSTVYPLYLTFFDWLYPSSPHSRCYKTDSA